MQIEHTLLNFNFVHGTTSWRFLFDLCPLELVLNFSEDFFKLVQVGRLHDVCSLVLVVRIHVIAAVTAAAWALLLHDLLCNLAPHIGI